MPRWDRAVTGTGEGVNYSQKLYCLTDRREIKDEVETDWNKKQRTTLAKAVRKRKQVWRQQRPTSWKFDDDDDDDDDDDGDLICVCVTNSLH